ncbi:hypothetical protein PFFCH_05553, partial [Plasmodium falciparum FCH/4]
EEPLSKQKCSCPNAGVPTYFDYVPQYLRWFEEWAEDFCRKKKKKVENLQKSCRGKYKGADRYCSRNGYDCEKTKRAIGKLRYGKQCISCLYACNPYVDWINNQKEQFDKQKKQCETVISGKPRQKRDAHGGSNDNGYEKIFYKKLQETGYSDVENFLDLLNKEKSCQNIKDEKEGKIDFKTVKSSSASGTAGSGDTAGSGSGGTGGDSGTNDASQGTFYRSDYCQPCPICGVKRNGNQWEKKDTDQCKNIKLYKPNEGAKPTAITILKSGDEEKEIEKKLNAFCAETNSSSGGGGKNSNNQDLYEEWKCYQIGELTKDNKPGGEEDEDDHDYEKDVKNGGGLCILENNDDKEKVNKQKTYNDFFNFWVAHVLKDSIEWRTQLTKCLSEDKLKKCEKGCKSNCECFKKWIEKKEQEWIEVKDQFNKQTDFGVWKHYLVLEKILEEYYFENIQKAYGDLKSIQEMQKIIHANRDKTNRSKDDVDALDVLFDHELEEAEDCLDIHEDEDDEDGDGNTCVEEVEKLRDNPCSGESGGSGSSSVLRRYPAVATKVAQHFHQEAKTQLRNRAGGRKTLRADASKGTYRNGGKADELKDVCKITNQYSNAGKNKSKNPCNGKGDRFEIGTDWQGDNFVNETHKYLYIPPRRQHMCTSNLEKLNYASVIGSNNVNDTFLVDVLLAAKEEADYIKNNYKDPNDQNKNKGICRAVRYSFADIGDIIRGRDMWDLDSGSKDMEKHFISIFKKIREQLPEKERKKYTDNDKYLELRADWWTANRRQVWKAMKCATKKDKNMKCNGIPIEDYIPQRLRWMTEWAEWFCKYQSQEYDKLMKECGECKAKGEQCTNGKNGCEKCKNACEKYKEEINKWKKQWNNMLVQYVILYLETHIAAANGGTHTYSGAVEPKDKPVVDFFKELQKTIKSSVAASDKGVKPTTSPYETAAGYIHQEIGYGGCQEQTQFCEYENGVIPTTDSGTNNKNYAFKNTPKDHDDACACKSRPKPEKKTEKPKEEEDPECKTVEGILKDNNGNEQVGECKKKDFTRTYPDWQCGNINLVEDRRVCMPPRRIKLCLYYLKELKVNEETKEQDLREAFIKTAAAETFLSWQYYKSKNSMDIKKLQSGEIPEEFLRSMYFTYGDYRDICLNTDISKKEGDVSDAKGKIDAYFNKYTDTNRTKWWDTNGPEIWEGMLCALTHGVTNTDNKRKIKTDYSYKELNKSKNVTTPLEKFAERPQFLRWMIEWGEEFCRERQKKENKIKDGCIEGDGCNNTQHPCNKACTEFQDYVKKKKKEFTGQTNKFVTDASKPKADPEYSGYEYKNGVTKQGNDYLKDKCDNKKCDCMEGNVLGDNPKEKPFGIYSHEYKNKCDCLGGRHAPSAPHPPAVVPTEQEAEPPPQEAPPKKTQEPQNNECTMVENLFLNDPEKKFKDACKQKYDGKYYGWKCVPTTSDKSDGSVCVPPRRRKLYIGKIKEWADKVANTGESQTLTGGESESTSEGKTTSKSSGKDPREALRDAFIQSAAVETFFAWHEYKEEKKPPAQEGAAALLKEVTPQEDPQNKLKSGTIPTDFLRQMFYTLGDYRDILFGDTSIVEAALSPSEKEKMKEIQKKIDEILEKSGNENSVKTVQSSRTTGPHSVKSHPNSGKDRKTWWNENAQHIWEGMICALTYKESENGDKTIVKDDKVYNKIFGTTPNNPIPKDNLTPGPPVTTNGTTGTPTGTYNDRYKYQTAKLEEENSGENTPLSKFVLRPPYFRYLEEWGQNFCKERKKRLAQIKKDCEQGGGRCSGYGENCDDNLLKKYTIVSDFNCPRCGTSCSFYKKWINTKRDEFNKQSNAFTKQKTDAHNNNGFCEKEGKCETAGDFLEKLKTGPCKNDSGEHKTGDDYIKFDDE